MKLTSLVQMQKVFVVPGLAILAIALAALAPPNVASRADGTFTILHTNDIHGGLREFVVDTGDATSQTGDPGRPYQEYSRAGAIGGMARLSTAIADVRRARGENNVLLVDAGDAFGDGLLANITRGEATMRVMDALGYTFMALGNHDYEYTSENTARLQSLVHFPMRGANAIVRATGQPFLGDPTLVVTKGGVRVGLLALTYHNTDQTGNKDNTKDLEFRSGIEAAKQYVPALRRRADVVVVVSHQGTVVDSLLAERVPGVDVIVGGHSHDRTQPPRHVRNTWMVQALSDASALGELRVTVAGGKVTQVQGTVHELYADRYKPDARIAKMVDSIRAPYRDTLEAVIVTAQTRIGRQYKSESPIDVIAAEVLSAWGQSDAGIFPGLGFGVTIQPGPVTREMLFNLFPHPTSVIHMRLTGAQIVAILEQSAANLHPADDMDRVGGLVQTSGMRWTVDFTTPVQHRIRDVSVGERPIESARTYSVVTNGGLLQGTHRQKVFAQGTDIVRDERSFAWVLEAMLRAGGPLRAPYRSAVTIVK